MGGQLTFKWFGEEAVKQVDDKAAVRMKKAAVFFANKVKEALGEPYPPASAPGELPHRRTGQLRRSISHDYDPTTKVARVGTNLKHGKWLELGTKRMAPRPFIMPTYQKHLAAIKAILTGGGTA